MNKTKLTKGTTAYLPTLISEITPDDVDLNEYTEEIIDYLKELHRYKQEAREHRDIVLDAVETIEGWGGEAYCLPNDVTDWQGDDVHKALAQIREVLGKPYKLKKYTWGIEGVPYLWGTMDNGECKAWNIVHAEHVALEQVKGEFKLINNALAHLGHELEFDSSAITVQEA